jgi:hypothetical protein
MSEREKYRGPEPVRPRLSEHGQMATFNPPLRVWVCDKFDEKDGVAKVEVDSCRALAVATIIPTLSYRPDDSSHALRRDPPSPFYVTAIENAGDNYWGIETAFLIAWNRGDGAEWIRGRDVYFDQESADNAAEVANKRLAKDRGR